MRVFELTTHIQSISRADGRSATGAAAYRACCEIPCEREGRTHDYRRKAGLEAAEIVLPEGAPEWAADRAKLWNAAELKERNGKRGVRAGLFKKDARPARELLFSFPAELSAAGRLNAARTIARHLVDTHRIAADFAIHRPGQEGDERNHHCHLMMTARRMTGDGLGVKAREWDDLKSGAVLTRQLRAFVASTLNHELAAERMAASVHVEHRSFKDRGEPLKATRHMGPAATRQIRTGQRTIRQAWQRQERDALTARQETARTALKDRQAAALATKLDALDRSERERVGAIRDRLQRDQAGDTAPAGLSRAFQRLTGQAGHADADRAQRSAARVDAADREIAAVRQETGAERAAYVRRQQAEQQDQVRDHKAAADQLKQAFAARARMDRTEESEARKDHVRKQGHDMDRSLRR